VTHRAVLPRLRPASLQTGPALLRLRLPAVLTAAAVAALAAMPSTAAAQDCGPAAAAAAVSPAPATTAAVRCLVNDIRASHGLVRLQRSGLLDVAARRHGADMVRRRYFAHDSPDGRTVEDRVRSAGYLRGSAAWSLGENLGWGTGAMSTPAAIVQAWMSSPPHRAVILNGRYRQIGVGIVAGLPVDVGDEGATYVLETGARE
jgi:uncharacterized protein YkwD